MEIIAIYWEGHVAQIHTLRRWMQLLNVRASGAYRRHCFLKCLASPIVLGQLTFWAFCINLRMSTGKWPLKLTSIFFRVKVMVLWNETPFHTSVRCFCFEGTFLLPLQDRRVTQDNGSCFFLRNAFYISTKLHGVTTQKKVLLILATTRT
jgi:hypothetical protein